MVIFDPFKGSPHRFLCPLYFLTIHRMILIHILGKRERRLKAAQKLRKAISTVKCQGNQTISKSF